MSVNSSAASNSSLDSGPLSCSKFKVAILISAAFNVTRAVLLLPLCILILYLGLHRWRQQRSFKTMSHCDIFTYHMAAMELIWGFGTGLFFCSYSNDLPEMEIVGSWLQYIAYYGENFFHLLTCVERYLAVVHPITYLGLRNARGVRIRNISIGCVWLLCCVLASLNTFPFITSLILVFGPLVFSLVIISFCSISVLCVLIRPGPGEGGRDKERVDQSKQRALRTVLAILGVLWLWFFGVLVFYSLGTSSLLSNNVGCVMRASRFWFNLPCSLVLPLLYLLRAGKLSCCCYNSG